MINAGAERGTGGLTEQEIARRLFEAEAFLEYVARPRFEWAKRELLNHNGIISRKRTSDKSLLFLSWDKNIPPLTTDNRKYLLTLEAGTNKMYRLYGGDEERWAVPVDPKSQTCQVDLQIAIESYILNNQCLLPQGQVVLRQAA